MQYVHETYIVPALKFNNALSTEMLLPPKPLLHAVKTWSQKKESDPCVMKELAARVLKCDFWHEQRQCTKEECMLENEDRKQVLGRKAEKKKGSKEERKKRRNKLALLPLARLFSPRG